MPASRRRIQEDLKLYCDRVDAGRLSLIWADGDSAHKRMDVFLVWAGTQKGLAGSPALSSFGRSYVEN
jgi:hypothetical protein